MTDNHLESSEPQGAFPSKEECLRAALLWETELMRLVFEQDEALASSCEQQHGVALATACVDEHEEDLRDGP